MKGVWLCRVKVPALLDRLRLGYANILEATPQQVAVMVLQLARQHRGAQDKLSRTPFPNPLT